MLEAFTWFKQSAYRYDGDGLVVYIDPWGVPDGSPPADAIFITHAHFDHFSMEDIDRVRKEGTRIVAPHDVAAELSGDVVAVAAGDSVEAAGVTGEVVPAYNIAEERLQAHPKENGWVGYVLTFGERTIYHAGDTDHIPDLSTVRAQVAFVPVGGTFTMDSTEAAGLVLQIRPRTAVPMHYGFVEGAGLPSDAEDFKSKCDPIEVHLFEPVNPFEFK
jgi:L-ascorbate metabolism protein UlaG (beta-lactamase superfamily)